MSGPDRKKRRVKKAPDFASSDRAKNQASSRAAEFEIDDSSPREERDSSEARERALEDQKSLVWRAVFIGAAIALILILIPSYLAIPRLGKTRLAAVDLSVPEPRLLATSDLPPYSAGIASGFSDGGVLVAVPSQKRIEVLELRASQTSDTASGTLPPTYTASVGFSSSRSIDVDGNPVLVATLAGRHLAVVGDGSASEIRLLDVSSDEVTKTITLGSRPSAIAVSENLGVVAVAHLDDASLTLIDLATFATKEIGVSDPSRFLAFSGTVLYVASETRREIEAVEVLTATKQGPVSLDFLVGALAACGEWLFVGDSQKHQVQFVNVKDPGRRGFLELRGRARNLYCMSGGTLAVGTDSPSSITAFRISTESQDQLPSAQPLESVSVPASPNFMAEISPGIVAVAGSVPPSTIFSATLVIINLVAVLVGGLVTGLIARRRYGAHAMAMSAVLVASYWLVFQRGQPQTLPFVLVFVGIPVVATAASGAWLAKIAQNRLGLLTRQAASETTSVQE